MLGIKIQMIHSDEFLMLLYFQTMTLSSIVIDCSVAMHPGIQVFFIYAQVTKNKQVKYKIFMFENFRGLVCYVFSTQSSALEADGDLSFQQSHCTCLVHTRIQIKVISPS